MIEAIDGKKTEAWMPVATGGMAQNTKEKPANNVDKKQEQPSAPYSVQVSDDGRFRQQAIEKCRSDFQNQVKARQEAGGSVIESYAVAYRRLRDQIDTTYQGSLRDDAIKELNKEFDKGVTQAAEELGQSFGSFFNYANDQNARYNFPMENRPSFDVAAFKENVMKLAYDARTAAMQSVKGDTLSLQSSIHKALGGKVQSAKLEEMDLRSISTLDTIFRALPTLQPTNDLRQVGQRSGLWEVIGEHLSQNAGALSSGVREKALAAVNANLQTYQKIGVMDNADQSSEAIHRQIEAGRNEEKAEYNKGNSNNLLVQLKTKLWVVESQWA